MGKCKLGEEKTGLDRLVSLKLDEKHEAGEQDWDSFWVQRP